MNRMPGFTAEAILRPANRSYQAQALSTPTADPQLTVYPAQGDEYACGAFQRCLARHAYHICAVFAELCIYGLR